MERHDYGAARVMDHFALIGKIAFADGIDRDSEDRAIKYFLTVKYLR
jgi:hypothetical protein